MKKTLIGVIIGVLLFTSVSYAYRFSRPARLVAFDDTALRVINDALEKVWDLSNGRFNLNVVTSPPTWTGKEGDIVAYSTGGVYRLYLYLNGGWRVWTSD